MQNRVGHPGLGAPPFRAGSRLERFQNNNRVLEKLVLIHISPTSWNNGRLAATRLLSCIGHW
jgi:hypothetical protein